MSFFFFLNNVKADCVSFILDVKVCYRVLLGYNLKLLRSRCSLCWRKLISWVCQAAMRALQATGSCYHSQVRHAGTLTSWRWQPSRAKVCVRTRASITRTCECVRSCVSPGLKTEICQWPQRLSAYLGFLQIPNNQWQDRREKEAYERERERAFCQSYPLWNGHRCNISQDKGSSV